MQLIRYLGLIFKCKKLYFYFSVMQQSAAEKDRGRAGNNFIQLKFNRIVGIAPKFKLSSIWYLKKVFFRIK